jgi:hypothetical protein
MLSTISSLYDPLGFVCPVLLPAKQMLQELCRLQLGWDERIPHDMAISWDKWLQELPKLSECTIPRCFKPSEFSECKTQMHHLSDASNKGYGTASYLRFADNYDNVHVSLVTAKARVAPLKNVTIPRLELAAAAVLVRMNSQIQRELQLEIDDTYFWTDSQTVIKYINNDTARFQTYVANRVT